jgi:hypothetical protein
MPHERTVPDEVDGLHNFPDDVQPGQLAAAEKGHEQRWYSRACLARSLVENGYRQKGSYFHS